MKILYDELGGTLTIPSTHSPVPLNMEPVYEIADTLSTSLGPSGCDKIIQNTDNEIIVTNDGATILSNLDPHSISVSMESSSPTVKATLNAVVKIIVELSQAQDTNIGDGTTSVVILAASILKNLQCIVESGSHPMKIIRDLNFVVDEVENFINEKSVEADFDKLAIKAAKTALYSKIVSFKSNYNEEFYKSSFSLFSRKTEEISTEGEIAKLCLKAINYAKTGNTVNLDDIKLISKPGSNISKSAFVEGILFDKTFAHPAMKKYCKGKVGLIAAPLELPKLKTKAEFAIKTAEEFVNYENYEKEEFNKIIEILKEKEIEILLCQFGFEDEMTSMLAENGIVAVRWVSSTEMENAAIMLKTNIASKVENIEGAVGIIEENSHGTLSEKSIKLSGVEKSSICTIFVRGSTQMAISESIRSIHDALCAIRNLMVDNKIVYGGGAIEADIGNFLLKKFNDYPDCSEIFNAFSRGMMEIPRVLLRNEGLDLSLLSKIGGTTGITGDMAELGVFETATSKISQIKMAKEVCCRLLKIDEVIFVEEEI